MVAFTVTAPDGNEYDIDAPEGATEEQALVYAKQQWEAGNLAPASALAGPASQADARKAEPAPMSPMAAFDVRSKTFENAMQRFIQETGGTIKPGQNIRQAAAEWAKTQDPESERTMAEIEELAQGGNVQYGGSVPYAAAKTLASVGGFALGGPFGATGAEAVVRGIALASNLKKAVDAGAITEDRAAEILSKEMAAGTTEDLAWNVGVPLLGQVLAKVPGVRSIVEKVAAKLKPGADLAEQQAAKVAARVKDAQTPAAKQAVEGLSARMGETVLTPGQVTGQAGFGERVARAAGKDTFAKQERVVQDAGEALREAAIGPFNQPLREPFGVAVKDLAEKAEVAMKKRLRPIFKAADNLGVKVDFSDVLNRAKAALAHYERVPGAKKDRAKEISALTGLVDDLTARVVSPQPASAVASRILGASGAPMMKPTAAVAGQPPLLDAEPALDFISWQKENLRATGDWNPSTFYETVTGGLMKSADDAFTAAAAGRPEVATALKSAQTQYREVLDTAYKDAFKQALKTNKPEDIGRYFWQAGNVSEPKQLQRMLALAQREGTMTVKGAEELNRTVTRGFLQEAVPNIDTAAQWSRMLREKPSLRDTWNTLTAAPGGKELRSAMEVLEAASQIATRGSAPVVIGGNLLRRAEGLGLGFSYYSGLISPGMMATGLAILPLTRMMSTAYSQGNKGILNMIARSLRAQSAGTAAGAKALQAALPVLEEYAAEHGITDLFVGKRGTPGQASEPNPTTGQ